MIRRNAIKWLTCRCIAATGALQTSIVLSQPAPTAAERIRKAQALVEVVLETVRGIMAVMATAAR